MLKIERFLTLYEPLTAPMGVYETHLKKSPYSVVSCPQSPILDTPHTPQVLFSSRVFGMWFLGTYHFPQLSP